MVITESWPGKVMMRDAMMSKAVLRFAQKFFHVVSVGEYIRGERTVNRCEIGRAHV